MTTVWNNATDHSHLPETIHGVNGGDGSQGPQGDPGAPGQDGAPGLDGAPGQDGADGASAYEIALANGFVGTEVEWLASLVGADGADGSPGLDGQQGVKGDKGDPGDQGLPGQDGADGSPGLGGADGSPGADGADGNDGASAYQVDLAAGFVGNEAAWLASLVGPAGADGADGQDGSPGLPGADGQDGAPGADGNDGAPGADGNDGAPGAGVVAGMIVMWGGLVANIPAGWVLCNGANGTPDLRDRFIKGAANGANPGATGGATTHTHAAHTGVINHTHALQRFPTTTGGSSGFTADTSMSGTPTAVTLTTGNPSGGVASLTHDSPDSQPPFYALCFIQKT